MDLNQPGTRPATQEDIIEGNKGGVQIRVGDPIAPAGVYVNEEGSFVALMHPTVKVGGMFQALMLGNNQVGMGSLWGLYCLVDGICGNHIYWGADIKSQFSIRHLKNQSTSQTFAAAKAALADTVESGGVDPAFEQVMGRAQKAFIADSKEATIEKAFEFARAKRMALITEAKLTKAFEVTEATPRYGNPTSVWGLVSGLTDSRTSQRDFAGKRMEYDRQAGRFLEMVDA